MTNKKKKLAQTASSHALSSSSCQPNGQAVELSSDGQDDEVQNVTPQELLDVEGSAVSDQGLDIGHFSG